MIGEARTIDTVECGEIEFTQETIEAGADKVFSAFYDLTMYEISPARELAKMVFLAMYFRDGRERTK